jgi:hypothetical protein
MKIVYTNLQENDFGVKRSVHQLQVDFNKKGPERNLPAPEEGLQKELGGGRRSILSDSLFAAKRRRGSRSAHLDKERNGRDAHHGSSGTDTPPLRLLQNAGSMAGYYIRRFIETQLRTSSAWVESGSRINIVV